MDDYKKISKCFVEDEPIFTRDIEKLFPNRSRAWINKTIRIAVETQTIRRYEQGIYYIPRKTLFGVSSLDPQKVILNRNFQKIRYKKPEKSKNPLTSPAFSCIIYSTY